MSAVKEKAASAERLLKDPAFFELCEDMRENACALFSNPFCGKEEMWDAHEKIRAVNLIIAEMQSRIDAGAIERKREDQHRNAD